MRTSAKRRIRRKRLSALLILALALAFGAPEAEARDPRPTPSTQTRKAQAVGRWAFEKLETAHKLLEQEKYGEVLEVLADMERRRGLSELEQALMWQTYGYAYSSQEKYKEATEAFEKSLAAGGLEPAVAQNITYNMAQLYVMLENYDRAVELFGQWFAEAEKPNASAHYMYAIALMQKGDVDAAIPHAEQAVSKSSSPKESYLGLLLALYFETKNYEKAVPVVEKLVQNFPKEVYWKQLSALYAEQGNNKKALGALELAYYQGYLDEENEILNLAQLYLYNEVPYRAAQIVQEGLESGRVKGDAVSWQILADSFLQAREREKALEPLGKAAELAEDGNLYVRLAQLYLGEEQWSAARGALQKALQKGGVRNVGQVHLLLGIAYASDKQWEAAERSFKTAEGYSESERMAAAWIANLEREKALAE